jgi:hypothetical protein
LIYIGLVLNYKRFVNPRDKIYQNFYLEQDVIILNHF